ncbi:MAG: hypothetical protein SGI89_01520 [bacterium]|nr:hypothetical protein [bacterium]
MRFAGLLIFCLLIFVQLQCGLKPVPEAMPLSVGATLNLLQENPQFVMYLNFTNLRRTEFWKKNISDSLLNSEKTFGSLLNTFKLATGASISDGLDELYYSNSWLGENAIVMRGIFDKNKLNNFLSTDSLFSVTTNAKGKTVYIKSDNGLYFFFRDDFTICASNYLKQIDVMMEVNDTSKSGVLLNQPMFDAIQSVMYKQDLWMVSTEKIFIRGIFQNFLEATYGEKLPEDSASSSPEVLNDSAEVKEKPTIVNLYKRLKAISFSAKMSNELKLLVQSECIDEESAKYFRSILNGVITVAKLSAAGKENSSSEIFNKFKLERYDNSVFIEFDVDESNINILRKTNLMSKPENN